MGLVSVTYCAQMVTTAIRYAHNAFGFWNCNYLDDFSSAEPAEQAWSSYNLMGRIMKSIGGSRGGREINTTYDKA